MKRKKLARFLIAHNSFANPEEVFIIHTRQPAFIAQVHIFETIEAVRKQLLLHSAASVVQVRHLPVLLELEIAWEDPEGVETKTKILKQMADWYYFAFIATPGSADTELLSEPAN